MTDDEMKVYRDQVFTGFVEVLQKAGNASAAGSDNAGNPAVGMMMHGPSVIDAAVALIASVAVQTRDDSSHAAMDRLGDAIRDGFFRHAAAFEQKLRDSGALDANEQAKRPN